MASISELEGRTIVKVEGLERDSDAARFYCEDGSQWAMYHCQDCCESVDIDDVVGDPADLLGKVLSAREEVSSGAGQVVSSGFEDEPEEDRLYQDATFTWTFYVIQTDKGAVTIKWYGSSNGYYSESVDFVRAYEGVPLSHNPYGVEGLS